MKKQLLLVAPMLLFGLIGCNNGGGTTSSSTQPTPGCDYCGTESTIPGFTYDATDHASKPKQETKYVRFHYRRTDDTNCDLSAYKDWKIWGWDMALGTDGDAYPFDHYDKYGVFVDIPISQNVDNHQYGFIVAKLLKKSDGTWDWSKKDPDGDRIIYFSKFKKDENKVYHVYLQSGDKNIYTSPELEVMDEIKVAKFENMKRIYVEASSEMSHIKISEASTVLLDIDLAGNKNYRYNFPEGKTVAFDKAYTVQVTFKKNGSTAEAPIGIQSLYKTSAFADEFNYDGELGALYTKESTTFKVWSPVSKNIVVRIFDSGTPKSMGGSDTFTEYKLVKGEKGVFEVKVDGDLGGKYYTYLVSNGNYNRKEVVDPYAKSTGVNGLRGMIVDPEKVAVDGFETMNIHEIDRKKLTVYETHVADITSSSTWTSDANIRKYEKSNSSCPFAFMQYGMYGSEKHSFGQYSSVIL